MIPDPVRVTLAQARRFLLAHQGLLPPRNARGAAGVRRLLHRLHCIQNDPINVVGQNPHLVLQSRIQAYRPDLLNRLLYQERELIDGFDKQMSIYPMEDWPLFAGYRKRHLEHYLESSETAGAVPLMQPVLEKIRQRGPLSSLEIEGGERMDWWLTGSVRSVRVALEMLFFGGQIAVHHRVGSRRYFDLAERIVPAALRESIPPTVTEEAYLDWHVLRRAEGIGILDLKIGAEFGGTLGWRGGKIRAAILRLVEAGSLVPVSIAERPRERFFVRTDGQSQLVKAARSARQLPRMAFIAPLDNLMWDLGLIRSLFDFRYAWEVYKPASKRVYGYYVLPVLYGDQFIARMDPVFVRESRTFRVNNWWWEPGVNPKDPSLMMAAGEALAAFGAYLGAERVQIGESIENETLQFLRRSVDSGCRAIRST